MKQFLYSFILFISGINLIYATPHLVTCTLEGIEEKVSFEKPKNIGDLPKIEFSYPISVIRFSMRNGNLLLVAMDQEDTTRPRLFISAQIQKKKNNYIGQFMTDFGGNEIQLDNGTVSCEASPPN